MKTSEFNYELPANLIATHPVEPRDAAKLLVLERQNDGLSEATFKDLVDFLLPGDVLVFNDSKVIPARLKGVCQGRVFEVLLVKSLSGTKWECWVKPGRKARLGDTFIFSEKLSAKLLKREEDIFVFEFNLSGSDLYHEIEKIGEMPIPPYILKARQEEHDAPVDSSDYQTIYAKNEGSVAAPTAGLHFTADLLESLKNKGVNLEYVTLHVSLGTFQSVCTEVVEDFQIHSEYYEITPDTARRLNAAKVNGGRIIAVGTTTVRVLESSSSEIQKCGLINPGNLEYALLPRSGETNIFIYPGYEFKFVDGIITNFHLPKSSLLMLVSAFAGKENIQNAYEFAIRNKYRFYSYGDGMLIL